MFHLDTSASRMFCRSTGDLCRVLLAVWLAVTMIASRSAAAQPSDEPPKYEFRGTWIATVLQLDWPKSTTTAAQQAELITILDELKTAGVNAVFFQVRSEADAMYPSELEPWSYWLTGDQGAAPDPFYDPLQFAIEEAHKRGIELHAWFNPYRADRGSSYAKSPDHVTVARPEWILTFGDLKVLNPGIPEVRDYVTSVILDVVDRYDVDGVHFDDYFYPYPPNHIDDEDQSTYEEYNSEGFDNIGDWRRHNVNMLVQSVHEGILGTKPHVKFGISPFGIWKNGVPSGIVGLDAYNVIFADAVHWLQQQWIDYLTPQLYWPFGGGQDYGSLAPWWADHAAANDRHLYPGHGLYRSDAATFSGTLFDADEVPRQIRLNRQNDAIQGSVFFRARNITLYHSKGFADSLRTDYYRYPALTPIMDWRDLSAPPAPASLTFEWTRDEEVALSWTSGTPSDAGSRTYAVYRVRSATEPTPEEMTSSARNLLVVTGDTSTTDQPGIADDPYYYAVTEISANSIESALSDRISLEGRATSIDDHRQPELTLNLHGNYPNPFRRETNIRFTLDEPGSVSVTVYDVIGRRVASLVEGEFRVSGTYEEVWNGNDRHGNALAAGTYFYTVEVAGRRVSGMMVRIR